MNCNPNLLESMDVLGSKSGYDLRGKNFPTTFFDLFHLEGLFLG